MPNVEGENPDRDQLDLTDEDLILDGLPEEDSAEAEDADLLAEAEQPEESEEKPKKKGLWGRGKKKKEKPKKKEKAKKEKAKEEKPKKPTKPKVKREKVAGGGLRGAVATADLFTVMLGLALLAVTIAVGCLLLELKRYDFDIKAEEAKRHISAAPAAQLAPASSTAAA